MQALPGETIFLHCIVAVVAVVVIGDGYVYSINYSFVDAKLIANQTAYYRLKQVDLNGDFEYSPVRSIFFGSNWNIYPNPTKDNLYINASGDKAENHIYSYSLITAAGQELLSGTFDKEEILDISGFTSGLYILLVNNENGEMMVTEKIIKE